MPNRAEIAKVVSLLSEAAQNRYFSYESRFQNGSKRSTSNFEPRPAGIFERTPFLLEHPKLEVAPDWVISSFVYSVGPKTRLAYSAHKSGHVTVSQ
jgi:hypothetical protein